MTPGETGKQRQTRIELTYYKKPDEIARWRARLVLVAVVLAGLWFGLAPIWDGRGSAPIRLFEWKRLASPGPLARVHSTWESSCEACHVPFQPMNDTHQTPLGSVDTGTSNQRCQACHAGPAHHAAQAPAEIACSTCHHDHRGRDASLVRTEDSTCTSCHADLPKHRDQSFPLERPPVAGVVTRFDIDHHPEFSAVNRPDAGRLKFNHALHLAKGFTLVPNGKAFPFAMVAANERSRYGWTKNVPLDAAVPALNDCKFCHQLDSQEQYSASGSRSKLAGHALPARSAGAYMLPVTYENHCRACHPLSFDAKVPDQQMTHGLTPNAVVAKLRDLYTNQAIAANPKLLRRFVPPFPKPGEREGPVLDRIGQAVDDRLLTAVKILFGAGVDETAVRQRQLPLGRKGCVECHHLSPALGALVRTDTLDQVVIEPVNVPNVWFQSAKFDHAAHRALNCTDCHPAAKTSKDSTDILLPKISTCIECHAPTTGRGGKVRGGASDSCTECHRFHNGNHPLEGIGATARGVDLPRTIEEFLRGTTK